MYYCCGITDKGIMPHNEDSMMLNGNVLTSGIFAQTFAEPFTAAVSDGVSGEVSGETASRMCLENAGRIKYSSSTDLSEEIFNIHYMLREYSEKNPEFNNMQATLCGIAIDENENITAFNIGDSRLYRLSGKKLEQLSRDQSLVQLLYEEGTITMEEKRTHVHRNIIFPVIGNMKSNPQIDIIPVEKMHSGDMLILCTDGLSDYVEHEEMENILNGPQSPTKRLDLLVKEAIRNGSKDNITVILIIYTE